MWHSDAIVLVVGAVSYFLSALLTWRLPSLGPDLEEIDSAVRQALKTSSAGCMTQPATSLRFGRPALGVVGAGQPPYGVIIVGTILLFRNYFERGNGGRAGWLRSRSRRIRFGPRRRRAGHAVVDQALWHACLRHCAEPACRADDGLPCRLVHPLGCCRLGLWARHHDPGCEDLCRHDPPACGWRHLSGARLRPYDVLFNAVFIAATALAAIVLPADGRTYVVLVTASLWYLLIACTVHRRWSAALPWPELRSMLSCQRWQLTPGLRGDLPGTGRCPQIAS